MHDDPRVIRLASEDNVIVVTTTVEAGETLTIDGRPVVVAQRVPLGHKLAAQPIQPGQKVFKYGAPIGSAMAPIRPGDYVHTHNLRSDYLPE